MNDVKLNDLLLMWLPQFQSMQGKAQSQSTAAAVDKVKAIVKQAVTDYATKASAMTATRA